MTRTAPKYASRSGVIDLGVVVVLVLLGALGYIFVKPSSSQKNAKQSIEATANVDNATKAQSAAAAGGVAAIGQINAQAPVSPQQKAIAREIPAVLSKMEPPDLKAQNEALARMNAVVQGKYDLVNELYAKEAQKTQEQAQQLAQARSERRAVDERLAEEAAVGKLKDQIIYGIAGIAALLGAGWVYARMFSINMGTAGTILADIRAGVAPTQAFDTHLAPWHHASVNKAARLATPSTDVPRSPTV